MPLGRSDSCVVIALDNSIFFVVDDLFYSRSWCEKRRKEIYGETNTDTGIFDGADGKKMEQNSLDSNSNSEKTSTEGMQVYFCKHQDSCGLKPYLLRGPATVDSANNGKTCYCVGPESLSLQTDCYRGSCCDTKNSKCSEHPDRLCRFTVETSENLVSMSNCSNKFLEAIDPMLKHYGENSASTWIDTKKD